KGKKYSAIIDVKTIYLAESPAQKAYIVELSNIRSLSQAQNEKIVVLAEQKAEESVKPLIPSLKHEPEHDKLSLNIIKDAYEDEAPNFGFDAEKALDIDEEKKQNIVVEPVVEKEKPIVKEPPKKQIVEKKDAYKIENDHFVNYVYDPHFASDDLGLPIDLVEEFVQDFIAQANSFKNDLYESAKNRSSDNLKIQSHKLKGVAANLRIEDALDALTTINTSSNDDEIIANLDRFYKIIDKLSNIKNSLFQPKIAVDEPKKIEEDFVLSFKDSSFNPAKKTSDTKNPLAVEINDSDVPDSINIPELADDEFLKQKPIIAEENLVDDDNLSALAELESVIQEEIPEATLNYDKKKIAHDIGLDVESFNELFEDYLNETKVLSMAMGDSIEKNNLLECKNAAIKLKGMSENMRIHDFDDSLEAIINSADSPSAKNFVKSIALKLDLISKKEDQ
ncbi:MAG: HPt protein, partial [Campylobacterota bacterium]|nr:HPt protein [Campylobacterota bacterium]